MTRIPRPLVVCSMRGAPTTGATTWGSKPNAQTSPAKSSLSSNERAVAMQLPQRNARTSDVIGSASWRSSHRNAGTTTVSGMSATMVARRAAWTPTVAPMAQASRAAPSSARSRTIPTANQRRSAGRWVAFDGPAAGT